MARAPRPGQSSSSEEHTSTQHNIREHLGTAPVVRKDAGLQDVHNPLKVLFGNHIKDRKKK